MRSSRHRDWKIWGYRAHELITSRTDSDLHDVGKVVVVSWPFRTQVTGRIISLFQSHQQGLSLFRFTKDYFLRDDTF